ncbi:MAG: hypothetical protein QXQ66_07275 [Candidatus Hadarchaeum sp.]|uniref:hypothetical protein n=1 Tax=Candidatus Hadarchaeum sp. TaxID=2883567 RepID=UPI00317A599B
MREYIPPRGGGSRPAVEAVDALESKGMKFGKNSADGGDLGDGAFQLLRSSLETGLNNPIGLGNSNPKEPQ